MKYLRPVKYVRYIENLEYKPIVSVSLAEEFNEVVAMDLKFIESNIILHLIEHVTRFSAAAIVKSKEREEIIKHLFRSWISIFGAPSKFFSGNGGEFSNDNYNAMGEVYNITIKKTAAESPFSNGLVERHNAVLEEMLLKTCEDTGEVSKLLCNGSYMQRIHSKISMVSLLTN